MSRTHPAAEKVDRLLRLGMRACDVARHAFVTKHYVEGRSRKLRAAEMRDGCDTSVPKFSEDARLCEAVVKAAPGGMPILVVEGPALGAWVTSDLKPWRLTESGLAELGRVRP